ncbi:MAG TPA: GNAT family N-acetyltransferase [Thermoanaerobaculia bacterium]|jgi:GNAT superfamily N-acetyltransferase|nr:GNAT family N-acetyltransferase [Thermoanaerobaculia bacterium]
MERERARIRTATGADAPVLARLRYRFRIEHGEPIETEEAFAGRCASWMAGRLGTSPQWRCWVAEQPSGIVGNLWLQLMEKLPNPVSEPEHHAYITNVYVLPDCRNAGIGALLLEAALEWCRNSAIDAVFLWPSERSRSFYMRYGFSVRDDLFALRPVSKT